jgi:hypothetical protein
VSWLNRRLQLLAGLSDAALAAVCEGRLWTCAANRIVARVNREHADRRRRSNMTTMQDRHVMLSQETLELWRAGCVTVTAGLGPLGAA